MKPESSRYLFILGIILLVLVIGAGLFAWSYDQKLAPLPDAGASLTAKDPQSFTTFETGEDFRSLKEKNKKALESYGWVNQSKQIVHIPIERAMRLMAERQSHE